MKELIIKHSNIFMNILNHKKHVEYYQQSIPVLYTTKENKSKEKYKIPLLCYENFGYESIDELHLDLFLKKDKINLKVQLKNDGFYKTSSLDHYALLGNIENGKISKDVNTYTRQCKLLMSKNKSLHWHKQFKLMILDFIELSTKKDEKYRLIKPTVQLSILKNTEKELSEYAAVAIIQEYNTKPYVVLAMGSLVTVVKLEDYNNKVKGSPFMKGLCNNLEQYMDDDNILSNVDDDDLLFADL